MGYAVTGESKQKYLDRPIIIIGFGRSGTSILSDAIMQHPDLAYISNYNARFTNSDNINVVRRIFDNRFWRILGQKKQLNKVSAINRIAFKPAEAYGYWNLLTRRDFGRGFLFGLKEDSDQVDHIRERLSFLVRLQGKKRLCFKITGPSRLCYLDSVFPDAVYLHVRRLPLPNIRSMMNVGFYQNRKHGLWWHGEGVYTDEEKEFVELNAERPELIAALQYYKVHETHNAEARANGISNRMMSIDFEDFVSNPKLVVRSAIEFSCLKRDRFVDDFIKKNKIYDRNKKNSFYFSMEMDREIERIATRGVV